MLHHTLHILAYGLLLATAFVHDPVSAYAKAVAYAALLCLALYVRERPGSGK